MVGHHQIDRPISKALPQSLAIFTAANRRRTFAQRRSVRDGFRAHVQIVRAGLHAYRKSVGPRNAQFVKCLTGREMDDVQTKAVFATQRKHQPDGSQFRIVGPRLKIRRVTAPIGTSQRLRRPINGTGKFRVHQERQASPGDVR